MTLLEAIQPYIDPKTGCVLAADGGNGNEALFTAILLDLCRDSLQDPAALNSYGLAYSNCLKFMHSCAILGDLGGLYTSYPGVTENSVDNYIGLVSSIVWIRPYIISYGQQHWWSFAVELPGHFQLKDCYLRFVGFRPYVLMMNNESIGLISQTLYSLAMLITLFTGATDVSNIQLQWLQNRGVKGKHRLIDWTMKVWQYIAMKRWPGGMQQVFAIYNNSPTHPFAVFGPKDFS